MIVSTSFTGGCFEKVANRAAIGSRRVSLDEVEHCKVGFSFDYLSKNQIISFLLDSSFLSVFFSDYIKLAKVT